jgi:hypothetical protein
MERWVPENRVLMRTGLHALKQKAQVAGGNFTQRKFIICFSRDTIKAVQWRKMALIRLLVYLMRSFSNLITNSAQWSDMWMMNWKGFERKRSWPNLRYYPNICLEGLRKTTKIPSQDSRFPGRDLNPGPPEYEAGVLTGLNCLWSAVCSPPV